MKQKTSQEEFFDNWHRNARDLKVTLCVLITIVFGIMFLAMSTIVGILFLLTGFYFSYKVYKKINTDYKKRFK